MKTTDQTTDHTIIFGRYDTVKVMADRLSAPNRKIRYGDGQEIFNNVERFQGGYDDYGGVMAWAKVPGKGRGSARGDFRPNPAFGQVVCGFDLSRLGSVPSIERLN
jgi:hypothetical protein